MSSIWDRLSLRCLGTIQEEMSRWQMTLWVWRPRKKSRWMKTRELGATALPFYWEKSLGPHWGGLARTVQGIWTWFYRQCVWPRSLEEEVMQLKLSFRDGAAVCGGETWVGAEDVAHGRGGWKDGEGSNMWGVLRMHTQQDQGSHLSRIARHTVVC